MGEFKKLVAEDFQILDRDSKFFDLRVAQLKRNILEVKSLNEILASLKEAEVDLAYYMTDEFLKEIQIQKFYQIKLVEKRILLTKDLSLDSKIHPNISEYNESEPSSDLLELALMAGQQTRFNTDPNFSPDLYKKLFSRWIEKSVSGEMASHVLVYKIEERIVGFVSLRTDREKPHVVLLAVHPDFEGRGIAFMLLSAAERIFLDLGFTEISGATLLNNKKALSVYKRHGSQREKIEYVYHFWKNKIDE
ncbi:GNAT family N-acetyltransferase [Christiangramia crocea]|uniref:GNAT family N-acetyltransferase n=1 Tax=Christiangramia crocea TaxID=2904124 RepID=A0A9X1UUE9_9FLAO|nr:GNAT family N-acetyltransferase [Gramella crocea]MCG9970445.1 GNAT family N-acetyltransferase [Gramella crocea]